ncbi:glutathione S-transferase family protein [Variovorax dokdonensis]|uniref:Glutathione S-transferase family protein n=1 Tax=Variovorax dokdonensis TaxID=344883 RepID=A0ABT7N906_9BURK|nr:glutathione S-transferase family protein [Variovorax dokdonensis]MDM0044431.1 glutathione S-transferase family protein [Variovorax dokdonensis]
MSAPEAGAPQLVLHHFPGACSQVCVFALEHAGLDYELRLVDLKTSEQSGVAYSAISPLGKVPALIIDGAVLTENAAIQTYIHELRPQAGLFPRDASPLDVGRRQAGLSLCGGTLHPIVRGLANPLRITDGDPEGVRRKSQALAVKSFGVAEERIAQTGWWLDDWSLLDVYLNWAVSVAASTGFDFKPFPTIAGLAARLSELPAFRRMLEIEVESAAELARRRTLPSALAVPKI